LPEDFQKILKHQISWKSTSGSRDVPCGRTDRHKEANTRSLQFCEHAWTHIY